MDTLLISNLATARNEADRAAQTVGHADGALKLTQEYKALALAKEEAAIASQKVSAIETMLRQSALDDYAETGNKKPHEKVVIKMFTTVKYDLVVALDYARVHLPNCTKLDAKAFEKAAPALGLDFVTVEQEPRVQIASDLSEFAV